MKKIILLISAFSLASYAHAQTTSMLAGRWSFDNTLNDASTMAHHLTATDTSSARFVPGIKGQAYNFTNNHLFSAMSSVFPVADAYSVSFFVKNDTSNVQAQYPTFMEMQESIYSRYNLSLYNIENGFYSQLIGYPNDWLSQNRSVGNLGKEAEWKNYTFTWDGDTAETFINGESQGRGGTALFLGFAAPVNTVNQLYIGIGTNNATVNSNKQYRGELDEIYYYHKALNANEVEEVICATVIPEVAFYISNDKLIATPGVYDSVNWVFNGDTLAANNTVDYVAGVYNLIFHSKYGCHMGIGDTLLVKDACTDVAVSRDSVSITADCVATIKFSFEGELPISHTVYWNNFLGSTPTFVLNENTHILPNFCPENYVSVMVDAFGCRDSLAYTVDSFHLIDTEPTGISKANVASRISIYPNPTSENLQVINASSNAFVNVYSLDGKLQMAATLRESVLNVSDLKSGYYFLNITDQNYTQVIPFVKQ